MRLLLVIAVLFIGAFSGAFILLAGWPAFTGWVASQKAPALKQGSDPELERIVGKETAESMRGDARWLAFVSGAVFACGLRDENWAKELHIAMINDNIEKLAKFPHDANTAATRVHAYYVANLMPGLSEGE